MSYHEEIINDEFDSWFWCPGCDEPREVCLSLGQCPVGQEAKRYQESVENLLSDLEGERDDADKR